MIELMLKEVELSYYDTVITSQDDLLKPKTKAAAEEVRLVTELRAEGKRSQSLTRK